MGTTALCFALADDCVRLPHTPTPPTKTSRAVTVPKAARSFARRDHDPNRFERRAVGADIKPPSICGGTRQRSTAETVTPGHRHAPRKIDRRLELNFWNVRSISPREGTLGS